MRRLAEYLRARTALRLKILRLLHAAGPRLLVGGFALHVLTGLAPVAFIVATSTVVGRVPGAVGAGLGSPEWRSLRNALLVAGALFVLQQLSWPFQWALGEMITWRVDDTVRERVAAASFEPVGIAALEDPETLDQLAEIADPNRGVGFSPGGACAGMLALVSRYVEWSVASIFLAIAYTWWAGVAAALGALAVRFGIRSGVGRLGEFEGRFAPERRRRDYYRDLLATAGAAKEARVFGLVGWLRDRYESSALGAVQPVWRARRRIVYVPFLVSVPAWLVLGGAAAIGAARAGAAGELTLGELAFSLQAIVLISGFGTFFWQSDWQTEHGMRMYDAVERFEAAALRSTEPPKADPEGRPRTEIRFERVSFGYDDGSLPVLRNLELTIPAGRSLAIVGLNGAGKTTLVKLLARLYEPQSGRITVDGVDIRDFEPAAWRRRLGAIFQDFVHYDLPVRDNVGFGAPELLDDDERVRSALSRAGGLALVEALPHGLDTVLSREYEDGAELSGGQWQRIAIARALMAVEGGASVLVLDEPTANLDVRAEAEFFDQFLELTRGVTTILISHRFSSVRRADRIVVLEEGAVVEDGTHAELVARGGRYAELFRLQAERFAGGATG
ncbi:MAG: ATP-binding cassette, subfamily bacterial [Gaiellaceae bacterium]|nr:ATP-binding cassette, subfamily bacterial [Gaiellaceae bacterium]